LCVVTLPKEYNYQCNIHEIYWKDSEQRIKTAELKNNLLVE